MKKKILALGIPLLLLTTSYVSAENELKAIAITAVERHSLLGNPQSIQFKELKPASNPKSVCGLVTFERKNSAGWTGWTPFYTAADESGEQALYILREWEKPTGPIDTKTGELEDAIKGRPSPTTTSRELWAATKYLGDAELFWYYHQSACDSAPKESLRDVTDRIMSRQDATAAYQRQGY